MSMREPKPTDSPEYALQAWLEDMDSLDAEAIKMLVISFLAIEKIWRDADSHNLSLYIKQKHGLIDKHGKKTFRFLWLDYVLRNQCRHIDTSTRNVCERGWIIRKVPLPLVRGAWLKKWREEIHENKPKH